MALKDRVETILDLCRGKKVLHLGCADWPYTESRVRKNELLHAHIDRVAAQLTGVDNSEEGMNLLRSHNPEWSLLTIDAGDYIPKFDVDVIVATELIEHLENPGQMLRAVAEWAGEDAQLVITTPNAYALKGTLRAMCGREFCHPDHTVIFSTSTLEQLLRRTGWDVTSTSYYQCRTERLLARIPAGVIRALGSVASARLGDGLIMVSRKRVEVSQYAVA